MMMTITGHLAIDHAVTAAEPSPMDEPMDLATEPLTTRPRSTSATSTINNAVTASMIGRSFQNGRPSFLL